MCCNQNTVSAMHIQTLQHVHGVFIVAVGIAHSSKCSDIMTDKYVLLRKLYLINIVSHIIKITQEVIATLNASHFLHRVVFQHNPQSSLCIWPPCRVFRYPVTAETRFCPSQPFTNGQFQLHVHIIAELCYFQIFSSVAQNKLLHPCCFHICS
jgi:hypothetical protein